MADETRRALGSKPSRTHRNWVELGLIGFAAALTYGVSSSADLYERFHAQLANYEGAQADELFIVILGALAALSVFSYMRWKEARAELASRIAAEHELQVLSGRNRELARSMIGLQDFERKRIARELHDHFGQSCNAIRIDAVYLCNNLREGTALCSAAERISATADDLYQTVRGLLQELRPVALDSLGLHGALQALCESWEERSAVNCALLPHGDLDGLGEEANMAVYRIVQESLSNVVKHSGASHVRISLDHAAEEHRIDLIIEDDGQGCGLSGSREGLGWMGMKERAAMLRGTLTITPSKLGGVMVRCSFPVPLSSTPDSIVPDAEWS
ncbi:MAG: sensor histidine kinase [Methyloversatilis sp.]|jgi:two-component system sensor histidine kinase UhpB|nr:sensor histidine kinase [Methyloversatilis sp.]MBP6194709.1 sensor histidine kinase [Methyloversatilis sp.]MBP9116709.1 sensor histidine kinase [Methyloversatilis sp.]